ncbi:hypothetical protein HKI87_01g08110 [Chloropicon roscoffensis]|uniref:Uncharacterized protein n=1 Tax=Chloropicon roscoffensis TaxID=1461544 RepID=A0AAX4P020_9CHLO
MAWSNFLMTAAVIGGLFYMTKSDVRQGASMFRRNVKTIRSWIEQGEQSVKPTKPKEIPRDVGARQPPKDKKDA